MVAPESACEPAFGDMDSTMAVSSDGPLTVTWKPALSNWLFAWERVRPVT